MSGMEMGEPQDMFGDYPSYACQGCGAVRPGDPTVAPRRVMLDEPPENCCKDCHQDALETAVYLAERAAGWDPYP